MKNNECKNNLLEVIKKFDLEKGKYINLEEFEKIYADYQGDSTKLEFAQLLGIKRSNYFSMRNKGTRAKILSNINLSEEEKNKILFKVIEDYNLHKNQRIFYKSDDENKITFTKMRNEYKIYFSEEEFAELIGISSKDNLKNIKYKPITARILTNFKLSEEEKLAYFNKYIKNDKFFKVGKKITYVQFKDKYQEHRIYFTESEFAEILGLSDGSYEAMKFQKKRSIIKDFSIISKVRDIKLENRFYSREEINDICITHNITINQFIIYVIQNVKINRTLEYKKALENNDGIWMGKYKMNNEFFSQIYNVICPEIDKIVKSKARRYQMNYYKEELIDLVGDYIYENCGDLERNFKENNDLFQKLLYRRVNCLVRNICIKEKIKETTKFFEDYIGNIKDKKQFKPIVRYKLKEDNKDEISKNIFEQMAYYYSQRYSNDTIKKKLEEEFGLSEEEILKTLQIYIKEKEEDSYIL